MGVFTDINYKDSHFEKAELTPIRGEPTYSTLEHLLKELKANARNVHSNLGGGAHGHLGLVISPASYAHLSATPFTPPVFPGTEATLSMLPALYAFNSMNNSASTMKSKT